MNGDDVIKREYGQAFLIYLPCQDTGEDIIHEAEEKSLNSHTPRKQWDFRLSNLQRVRNKNFVLDARIRMVLEQSNRLMKASS